MLRGPNHCSALATLAVSILLVAAAAKPDSETQAHGELAAALADLSQTMKGQITSEQASPLERPCANEGGDRQSDLCAQWTAADAAGESAIWTRRSGIATIAGLLVGFGTLLAASAAAWYARSAAKHAKDAVEVAEQAADDSRAATNAMLAENGRQRRLATLPILTIETGYFGLNLVYPWPTPHDPNTMVSAIDPAGGPTSHAILLKNHGQGAALDVRITFSLDPDGTPIQLTPWAAQAGVEIYEMHTPEGGLTSVRLGQGGGGWPLYRNGVVDIPVCAAGSTTTIGIPYHVLIRLFTLGLRERAGHGDSQFTLSLTVSYTSVDGERLDYKAAFLANPFSHGPDPANPASIRTHVHWQQLPATDRPPFRAQT